MGTNIKKSVVVDADSLESISKASAFILVIKDRLSKSTTLAEFNQIGKSCRASERKLDDLRRAATKPINDF